jgi:acyl-CoA thioester hydrolase
MDWDWPHPFTQQAQVEPKHIDGLQHTNNAVYVKWCEQVAWGHSVSLGLDLDCYQKLDRAMVITHSEFDYLRASHLKDELTIATWIVSWDGRLTMSRRFQIIRKHDQQTILRAGMDFACVELSTGKPRRLPSEFIQGYGPAVASGAGPVKT